MNWKRLLLDNLVKKLPADYAQIEGQIKRAEKDLAAAALTLGKDSSWTVTIAYHAMLRAGRALMYSQGYLPTDKRTHKTIVECTGFIMGKEYTDLVSRFERLRRKRHGFIYDSENDTTAAEAERALANAAELIRKISSLISQTNPQRRLDFYQMVQKTGTGDP